MRHLALVFCLSAGALGASTLAIPAVAAPGFPKVPKVPKLPKKPKTDSPAPAAEEAPAKKSEPAAKPMVAAKVTVAAIPDNARIAVAPGARTIAPSAPTYCVGDFKPYPESQLTAASLSRVMHAKYYNDPQMAPKYNALYKLYATGQTTARLACTYPKNAEVQAWVANARQILENDMSLPDSLMDEALGVLLHKSSEQVDAEFEALKQACGGFSPNDRDPKAEADKKSMRRELACDRGKDYSFYSKTVAWRYDQQASLDSEIDRAALLHRFTGKGVGRMGFNADNYDDDGEILSKYLFIRHDAKAYDPSKVVAEAKASDLPDFAKLNLQLRAYEVAGDLRRHEAIFAKTEAKVPELTKIFAAADAGFAAWEADYNDNSAYWDRALALEEAMLTERASALEGCRDKIGTDWHDYVGSTQPKTKADVDNIVFTPTGYIVASAAFLCEKTNDNKAFTGAVGKLLSQAPRLRGPRTAAVYAGMDVVALERADFERFPYDPSDMLPYKRAIGEGGESMSSAAAGGSLSYSTGVVASATPDGDLIKLTFKTNTYKVAIQNCVETNKIDGFWMDGTIRYRQKCTITGYRDESSTVDPMAMHKRDASGVKPGATLRIRRNSNGESYLIEAYAPGGMETLVNYYGFAL